jgi:hypothetical protein
MTENHTTPPPFAGTPPHDRRGGLGRDFLLVEEGLDALGADGVV